LADHEGLSFTHGHQAYPRRPFRPSGFVEVRQFADVVDLQPHPFFAELASSGQEPMDQLVAPDGGHDRFQVGDDGGALPFEGDPAEAGDQGLPASVAGGPTPLTTTPPASPRYTKPSTATPAISPDNLETTWKAAYPTTIRSKIAQVWARIAEITEADQPDEAAAALEAAIEFEPANEELMRRLLCIRGGFDHVRTVMRRLEARLADLGSTEPLQEAKAVAAGQLARGRTCPDLPAGPAAEPAMSASTS
jgi:hypothetical protein